MLIDDAIAEFGDSMGIPSLKLNESGKLALSFDGLGTLFFEQLSREDDFDDPELLVYLARDHGPAEEVVEAALAACHYERAHPQPVDAGLSSNGQLVFATRLQENEVTLPSIEASLELLTRLHNSLKSR